MRNHQFQNMDKDAFYAHLRKSAKQAAEQVDCVELSEEEMQKLEACMEAMDANVDAQLAVLEACQKEEAAAIEAKEEKVVAFRRKSKFVQRVAIVAICMIGVALAVPTVRGVATYMKKQGSMIINIGDKTLEVTEGVLTTREPAREIDDFHIDAREYTNVKDAENQAWDYFEEYVAPFRIEVDEQLGEYVLFQKATINQKQMARISYTMKGGNINIGIIYAHDQKKITMGVDEDLIDKEKGKIKLFEERVEYYRMDNENTQGYCTMIVYDNLCITISAETEKEDFIEFVENLKIK